MNHCKTIAIVNQKGGVGKTTSTVNLGVGLAQAGNRVLLVDDDPQHSLTISLGIRNADDDLDTTLATAMQAEIRDESVPWEEGIIHSSEGVDLLPANIELSGVEMSLFNAMSREQVLKSVLSRVKENYDYILIDCMPSLGLMSVNALVAADSVIIPSAPDFLSTKGLNLLIRTISRVRRQINPKLKIDGILMTMVDGRTNNAKSIIASLRSTLGGSVRVFDTEIPRSVRAAEASGEGKSIFAFDPKSRVAQAYANLAKKQIDLGLTGLDELFMDDKERAESKLPKIHEIPLSEIDEFPDHPFHVRLDEDMDQLVESIKERGIITPVTLRQKPDGRYEIVSGHRRTKACELAGLTTVKAEIKELSRDEAIILMVESNLQRTTILPSEKAFSYKMRLEAMKRQVGRPSKENASPVATNSPQGRSDVELGEQVGESKDQVRRYIRLTNLIPPLLDLVDTGKIAFRPAVELSYLTEEEQNSLLDSISSEQSTPSLAQALKMKEFSQNGRLNADVILSIMCEQKPNQREKISFQSERLKPFIPKNFTAKQTEDYVIKALEYYHRYQVRQKERDR